jgi:hypothetical protein
MIPRPALSGPSFIYQLLLYSSNRLTNVTGKSTQQLFTLSISSNKRAFQKVLNFYLFRNWCS